MLPLVRTRRQLEATLGRHGLQAAIAAGSWVRVLRGAYVTEADPGDLAVRAAAARLLLPRHAVVAGHSTLWLCGVDVQPTHDAPLEVVVPRGRVVPHREGVCATEGLLTPADRGSVRGLPSLSPQRAALDLLRRHPLPHGVAVADAVQAAGLRSRDQLEAEAVTHAALRGVRRARRALELSDPRAESPPESRLRVILVLGGLSPVPQLEVRDDAGRFLARVDLALPGHRLALEYDGREVHTRPDAFVRDRQRHNALVAAGWTVLRFTAGDLRQPDRVLTVVRAALLTASCLTAPIMAS